MQSLLWISVLLFSCIVRLAAAKESSDPPYILYINLAPSTDRFDFVVRWLSEAVPSKQWTRVDAINAYDFNLYQNYTELLVHLTIDAQHRKHRACKLDLQAWTFGTSGSLSAVACRFSHAKAITVAYAMGVQEVLILEDDMGLMHLSADSAKNHNLVWSYLRHVLDSLPAGWKVLQASTLIFSLPKIHAIQTAVLDGILWSKRDGCTGTDFALWGAGAYVMSRRGMHDFISRHMPQFLHATVKEAEQFCAVLDVRNSAPTTIGDFWVYDMSDVYYSHIPLFLPLAAIAAGSTVQTELGSSNMQPEQYQSVLASIQHLTQRGILTDATDHTKLVQALRYTQQQHPAANDQHELSRYILIPGFGMDAQHANVTQTGALLNIAAYDITTLEARQQFYEDVSALDEWSSLLWRTQLDSYMHKCRRADDSVIVRQSPQSDATQVHVLIPIARQLRGFVLPANADVGTMHAVAERFCKGIRGYMSHKEVLQFIRVLLSCMQDAMHYVATDKANNYRTHIELCSSSLLLLVCIDGVTVLMLLPAHRSYNQLEH
jgi:GR25 family glycosyltransferase involved in LPS biosynthesis